MSMHSERAARTHKESQRYSARPSSPSRQRSLSSLSINLLLPRHLLYSCSTLATACVARSLALVTALTGIAALGQAKAGRNQQAPGRCVDEWEILPSIICRASHVTSSSSHDPQAQLNDHTSAAVKGKGSEMKQS